MYPCCFLLAEICSLILIKVISPIFLIKTDSVEKNNLRYLFFIYSPKNSNTFVLLFVEDGVAQ